MTKVSHELYDEVYNLWMKASKTLPAGTVLRYTIQPLG
jgi:hypothetical protein